MPLLFISYNHIPVRFRAFLLLVASWGFYLYGSPESFWILLLVTLISYIFGKELEKKKSVFLLTTGITLILSFLVVFKYLGLELSLPVGISFYTFQTISYLIDVYRQDSHAEKDLLKYALFVSFFPQLVAGPIERPGKLIPQLKSCEKASSSQIKDGLTLLCLGYFKKVAIADFFAPLVDAVFDNPDLASGPSVLFASILFSLQIFADFSGYSDIARGSAKLFGIELSLNFNHPYLSDSLRDFWKRWHMTLTRWLTDYIYIPLGGNRKGQMRLVLNTLIVFIVSGIWHGVGLKFILWGLGHGLIVLLEDITTVKRFRDRLPRILRIIVNFLIVNFLWIFFRAKSMTAAASLIMQLPRNWSNAFDNIRNTYHMAGISFDVGILFTITGVLSLYLLPKYLENKKIIGKAAVIIIMAMAVIFTKMYQLESGIENAFIYFRF